jgi:hypothetical protein
MPRYTHDCDTCQYLGEYEEFDLYYCPRANRGSVIARYGNGGPEYASSMVRLLTDEDQAFLKANPDYRAGQAMLKALELRPV